MGAEKKRRSRLLLAGAVLALLATGFLSGAKAPENGGEERPACAVAAEVSRDPPAQWAAPEAEAEREIAGRRRGVYTLLLVGSDDGNGNTDSILVGLLDTRAHSLDLVSIPRDTLVNLDWSIRKINAVYTGTANDGGNAIEGLKREIRKLCGFTPDVYALVDLDLFVEAVDLIGGIDFEVPQDMDYDDPAQDLRIHLKAGRQHLDGEQAMGLVRYRSGYLNGDLDRLDVQHSFLQAALGQLLRLGNIPRLPELAALFSEHAQTDLSTANILWLARQTLLCRSEDIRFHTLPTVPATIRGLSYAVTDLEPWLEVLNDSLDPYGVPIAAGNLDLVYLDNGALRATSGVLRGPWYYN